MRNGSAGIFRAAVNAMTRRMTPAIQRLEGSWQCRKPNEDCVPKKEIDCDGKDAEGEGVVTERFEGPAMDEVKEHASGAAAGALEAGELIDGAGWEPSGFSGRGEPAGSYDG